MFRVHYFRCVYFCVVTESVHVFSVHHFRCAYFCIVTESVNVFRVYHFRCVFLCRHCIIESAQSAITLAKHVFLSPGNVLIQSAVHDMHTLLVFHGINATEVCFRTNNSTCSKDVLDI